MAATVAVPAERAPIAPRLAVVVFVVAALVNGWRLAAGGPYASSAHAGLCIALVAIAVGLHHRTRWSWYAALLAAGADSIYVVATASPGAFGSMIWPPVAVALLAVPSSRRALQSGLDRQAGS